MKKRGSEKLADLPTVTQGEGQSQDLSLGQSESRIHALSTPAFGHFPWAPPKSVPTSLASLVSPALWQW